MKREATEEIQLDEQSIREAAAAAVTDLQLETEVRKVEADGERWCIQFATDYGQFCDTFRDRFGKTNSFNLIREKIKRHILKQQQNKIRTGVRVRRGKAKPAPSSSDNLVDAAAQTFEGVVESAAEVAGEILNRASRLPETVLTALEAAATAAGPATEPPPQPASNRVQPLARITVKADADESTSRSRGSARKASTKKATTPARKKSDGASAKSKSATKKSGGAKKSTSAKKSGPAKKSAGRK